MDGPEEAWTVLLMQFVCIGVVPSVCNLSAWGIWIYLLPASSKAVEVM